MKKQKYDISGMTCSACSSAVERAVTKVDSVESVSVNLMTNSMLVELKDEVENADDIVIRAVENSGYGASVNNGQINDNSGKNHLKDMKKRLIVSLVFTLPLLYITMGHMVGMPIPNVFNSHINPLNYSMIQLILTLPVVYLGRSFYKSGFKTLVKKSPNMDSLIAIGTSASILYGLYAMIKIYVGLNAGNSEMVMQFAGDLYFESAAVIVTLITLGKYLEEKAKNKTSDAIKKLIDLSPKKAIVLKNNVEIEVDVETIVQGDLVIIKQGNAIPVDGKIVEGNLSIDESMLTGESMPVSKEMDEDVYCGSISLNGYAKIVTVKAGKDTILSGIINLVSDAQSKKAPIAKLADKISGVFVPIVMLISLSSMIIWLLMGYTFEFAMSIAVAVLVISCPCALGLATPTAIMVGTGKGAELGILIKGGESLERAYDIDTVVLDKTGTITEGKPVVTECIDYFNDKTYYGIIALLEAKSDHPLGKSIVSYIESISANNKVSNFEVDENEITNFENIHGRGIVGTYKGENIFIGNSRLMDEVDNSILEKLENKEYLEKLADAGNTLIYVAVENILYHILAIKDIPRESSIEAIRRMQDSGLEVIMLTGDNIKTAESIQRQVGIKNAIAQVYPEDKVRVVQEFKDQGKKVAMVGDGINDSPALALADIGIAIGAGTDIAIESADVVLMRSDLNDVLKVFELSKATMRNIKQNLFWAFFYNSIGIPIAAGVFYLSIGLKLDPMFAAAAMSLSSVTVVSNALRLRNFKPSYGKNGENKGKSSQSYVADNDLKYNIRTLNIERESLDVENLMKNNKEEAKMKKIMNVEGMMCGHCKANVEKVLNELEEVKNAEVSLEEKSVTIDLVAAIEDGLLAETVTKAGYKVIGIK